MSKFLRTIHKLDGLNQKMILQVDKCNECPLMKFHSNSCIAVCRVFSSEQGNIIDDFVLDYNIDTNEIYSEIDTPDWCRLAEEKSQLDFDTKTYTIQNDRVFTNDNAIIDRDLPLYKASTLKQKIDTDSLLPALIVVNTLRNVDNINNLTSDEAYDLAYDEYDTYSMFNNDYKETSNNLISKPKHEICSLCGEENESVSRDRNHGMCDGCWENAHKDDERKKHAFINNFRLKRGEAFKKEKFNISVLKIDNLKVLISK